MAVQLWCTARLPASFGTLIARPMNDDACQHICICSNCLSFCRELGDSLVVQRQETMNMQEDSGRHGHEGFLCRELIGHWFLNDRRFATEQRPELNSIFFLDFLFIYLFIYSFVSFPVSFPWASEWELSLSHFFVE
jgi:hypothetical protein